MFTIFPNSYKCRPCQPSLIFLQTSIQGDKPTACFGWDLRHVPAGSRQRSDWSDAGGYLQSSSWSLIERKLRNRNCSKLPPIRPYWPLDCLYQGFNWKLMLVQPIVRTLIISYQWKSMDPRGQMCWSYGAGCRNVWWLRGDLHWMLRCDGWYTSSAV